MRRDRGLPDLEIELQPLAPATDRAGRAGRAATDAAPLSMPPHDRRRQRLTIVSAVAATLIVLVALNVVSGDDSRSESSAPATTSAPITVPTTRSATPNILGTDPTRL